MNQSSEKFKAASIGKQFQRACLDLDQLLAGIEDEKAAGLREELDSSIEEYKQQGSLNIAFVGQYSAGKSTIISALTGQRDIKIDTDIATDQTTNYNWNGVRVVDTPGLFTDREDHDQITYKAIDQADLLVFCLTHMLFDNVTVANFKRLAYDKGYGWKMLLVVNKMSAEAGEESDKITSYQKSLAVALAPQDLADFPVCFIDAKDFCEGVDDDDEFLREISQFDSFTQALNTFVSQKSSYSKLDTPIRIVLRVVDDTEKLLVPNNTEDAAYLEILSQLSRRVEQERDRLRTKVKSIQLEVALAILNEGSTLAQSVGEETFTELNEQSEIKLREHYEKSERSLQSVLERAIESIRVEIEDELQKDLPQAFIARLSATHKAEDYRFEDRNSADTIKSSVEGLKGIAESIGAKFVEQATRETFKTGTGGVLRGIDVAGSNLHRFVKSAGKAVGYKFKPWEAVGAAKNLGNAARFAGPAAAFLGVAAEVYSQREEDKREQQKSDISRDIKKQFQDISSDIKSQIDEQRLEFEQQTYDDIQSLIEHERQGRELAISTASSKYKRLADIRHNLNAALADVRALAVPIP